MYGLKPIGTSRTTTYNSLDNLRILVRALHCRCRTDHLVKSHNHAGDWKEETHSHPPELTSQNDPAALPDRAPNQTSWAWAAGAASAGPWRRRRRRALFLGVPTGMPARHSGTGKEGGSQPGGVSRFSAAAVRVRWRIHCGGWEGGCRWVASKHQAKRVNSNSNSRASDGRQQQQLHTTNCILPMPMPMPH